MAKTVNQLSDKRVKDLTKPGRYGDGDNLALNVSTSGTKSWVFRYRDRTTGRIRERGLGSIRTLSLKEARETARKVRQQLLEGLDPIDEAQKARTAARLERAKLMTFGDCCERYIAAHESSWRNAKHRQQWVNTLETYAGDLKPLPVKEISTDLIVKKLEEIWTTKTETATRLRQRIEAVLDWATARKFRTGDNPARWRGHLDKLLAAPSKLAKVEHQAAMPYNDVPAFMIELRKRSSVSARLLELVVLTACRVSEAAAASWSEFDLDKKVWTIPAERMKAGREHRVALSSAAVTMLDAMPRTRDHVFPGLAKRDHINPESARKLLQKDMEHEGLTVHGFRSAFRDWAAERTSFPGEVVEAALAHVNKDKTEAAYKRTDLFAKRARLMEAWTGFLSTKVSEAARFTPINQHRGFK